MARDSFAAVDVETVNHARDDTFAARIATLRAGRVSNGHRMIPSLERVTK